MKDFLEMLTENAIPRLNHFRYSYNKKMIYTGNQFYDNNLRYGNVKNSEVVYFGFYKKLSGGKYVFIVFQRDQTDRMIATGNRFTVYLMRYKPVSMADWHTIKRSDIPKTNIGNILRYAFHMNNIPSENWWDPQDDNEITVHLDEALSYLENFAIPWIEDVNSQPIDLLFSDERQAFNQAISTILQGNMHDKGYELNYDRNKNTVYFSKMTSDKHNVHIVFGFGFDINGRKSFDVLVYRTKSKNPFDYNEDDIDRISTSLGFILQKAYKMNVEQIANMVHLQYDLDIQLPQRLRETYLLLQEYIIPWIETGLQ